MKHVLFTVGVVLFAWPVCFYWACKLAGRLEGLTGKKTSNAEATGHSVIVALAVGLMAWGVRLVVWSF